MAPDYIRERGAAHPYSARHLVSRLHGCPSSAFAIKRTDNCTQYYHFLLQETSNNHGQAWYLPNRVSPTRHGGRPVKGGVGWGGVRRCRHIADTWIPDTVLFLLPTRVRITSFYNPWYSKCSWIDMITCLRSRNQRRTFLWTWTWGL